MTKPNLDENFNLIFKLIPDDQMFCDNQYDLNISEKRWISGAASVISYCLLVNSRGYLILKSILTKQ